MKIWLLIKCIYWSKSGLENMAFNKMYLLEQVWVGKYGIYQNVFIGASLGWKIWLLLKCIYWNKSGLENMAFTKLYLLEQVWAKKYGFY